MCRVLGVYVVKEREVEGVVMEEEYVVILEMGVEWDEGVVVLWVL